MTITAQTANLAAARMESMTPAAYRLVKKKTGETVLQGCYQWHQGILNGHEWRDIPTVVEE